MNSEKSGKFRPFIVQSCFGEGTIFRVIEHEGLITRKDVTKLIEILPITIKVSEDEIKNGKLFHKFVNEPVETRIDSNTILVHPASNRLITEINLENSSYARSGIVKFGPIMCADDPGNGQLSTHILLDPKTVGIENLLETRAHCEIKIVVNRFPKSKESLRQNEPPSFSKFRVRELIDLITGEDDQLTVEQFLHWRDLLMYAVTEMRNDYENSWTPWDYSPRQYYSECWQKIDAAKGNNKELAHAISYVRTSVEYE